MTLQEIRSNLDAIVKKEVKGNRISPDDFNRILESAHESFFKRKLDLYLRTANSAMLKDAELDVRFIEHFLVQSTGNSLSSGTLDLTTIEATIADMAAILSVKGTYDSVYRKIDLVSPQAAMEMHHNLMGRSLTSFPVCYRVSSNLYFLPQNVTSVDLTYVDWPDVPFLDYYISTAGIVTYFDEGDGDHTWTTNEIDSDGTTHTTGDAAYTPVTKELDYEPQYHYEFMMECLAQLGMSLNNQILIEYAEGKKQQVNAR